MRFAIALMLMWMQQTLTAQIKGCTDPLAGNYDASAQINDGSCTYPSTSIDPFYSQLLPTALNETSGLLIWNNRIWTHNDDTDTKLYACKTDSANVFDAYTLNGVVNKDWEEITQDSQYIYIGDFGNNAGNRTDLKILRISKTTFNSGNPAIDTIFFSYENQSQFNPGSNNTDFDCEAFIAHCDSLYLFTKEWSSQHTTLYVLPKIPGTYTAKPGVKYNVGGLITGATFYKEKNTIVLSGYTTLLQPFLILLYDFKNMHVFSGNKRKINLNLPFHQVEGIATENGLIYFISNEKFVQSFVQTPAKLQSLDLNPYLNGHINQTNSFANKKFAEIELFPNPAIQSISFVNNNDVKPLNYSIKNMQGNILSKGNITTGLNTISISEIPAGTYYLEIVAYKPKPFIKHN